MSVLSNFLKLFKYDKEEDANNTFNIETALNENWDKVDAFASGTNITVRELVSQVATLESVDLNGTVDSRILMLFGMLPIDGGGFWQEAEFYGFDGGTF